MNLKNEKNFVQFESVIYFSFLGFVSVTFFFIAFFIVKNLRAYIRDRPQELVCFVKIKQMPGEQINILYRKLEMT